jgi:hypothetical protein
VTPDAALKKLEDKYGERRALTLIGFAMFVEMHGAKAMREKYDRMTVWRDLKALRDARVEPSLIDWEEVDSGAKRPEQRAKAKRRAAVA